MCLSAVSVLVVAQSSSEIPEGLMNDPVVRGKQDRGCLELPKSSDYKDYSSEPIIMYI